MGFNCKIWTRRRKMGVLYTKPIAFPTPQSSPNMIWKHLLWAHWNWRISLRETLKQVHNQILGFKSTRIQSPTHWLDKHITIIMVWFLVITLALFIWDACITSISISLVLFCYGKSLITYMRRMHNVLFIHSPISNCSFILQLKFITNKYLWFNLDDASKWISFLMLVETLK